MHRPFTQTLLRGITAAAIASTATWAQAQAANDRTETLEEIVITAQKRSQSLQEVPISVTALSAYSMEKAGITDIRDIASLAPSVNFSNAQSSTSTTQIRIRGVGTTGNNAGFESSVGVFIDGIYQPRPGIALGEFVDVAQVEVLRGPQGALFGRNTSAGALSIQTQAPVLGENGGFVSGFFGSHNLFGARVGYNLGVSDQFALRFAAAVRQRDGVIENVSVGPNSEDSNNRDRTVLRAEGLFRPSDDLRLRFIIDSTDSSEICCAPVVLTQGIALPPRPDAGMLALPTGNTVFGADIFATDAGNRRETSEQTGSSVHLDYDISDNISLSYVLGIRDSEAVARGDTDFSAGNYISIPEDTPYSSNLSLTSNELRIRGLAADGRVDWMIGLFSSDESIDETTGGLVGGSLLQQDPSAPGPLTGARTTNRYEQDTSVLSFFTHNIIQLSDSLNLTLGLRVVDESKQGGLQSSAGSNAFCPQAAAGLGMATTATATAGGAALAAGAAVGTAGAGVAAAAAALNANPSDQALQTAVANAQTALVNAQAALATAQTAIATATAAAQTAGNAWALGCNPLWTPVNVSEAGRAAGMAQIPAQIASQLPAGTNPFAAQRYGLYNAKVDDDATTGSVSLSYRPGTNGMLYASYSQGFKSGGINMDPTGSGYVSPTFKAETLDSVELGFKTTLLDGKMAFNATWYSMNIEDFQILELNGLSFFVFNAPEATSTGVELDIGGRISDSFSFQLGLGLNDTSVNLQNAHSAPGVQDFGGTCSKINYTPGAAVCGTASLPSAPETVVTFSASWKLTGGEGIQITLSPNLRQESSQLPHTGDLLVEEPSHLFVGLNLGIEPASANWEASVWIKNLTDEVAHVRTFGNITGNFSGVSGSLGAFTNDPQTAGVSFRYDF